MLKIVSALALIGMTALTGCNTISGAGADIKAGGQAIEERARDAQSSASY